MEELRHHHTRVDAIPFESEYQFMATLNADGQGGRSIFLKGAPEVERLASRRMRKSCVARFHSRAVRSALPEAT